jgi:hypothetical protein
MDLAVGMTTMARPEPYLARTYASLLNVGLVGGHRPLHVFAEPRHDLDRLPDDGCWYDHVAAEPLGCFPNWRRALSWLVDETTAGWLLVVQDDVVFRGDVEARLFDGMERRPGCGFLSPYTSPAMVGPGYKTQQFTGAEAWIRPQRHNNAFWGALALCLPRTAAAQLLYNPRFLAHRHSRKVDVLAANCLWDMHLDLWVHLPSLAEHIGEVSTIGRDKIPGNRWARRGYLWRPEP